MINLCCGLKSNISIKMEDLFGANCVLPQYMMLKAAKSIQSLISKTSSSANKQKKLEKY